MSLKPQFRDELPVAAVDLVPDRAVEGGGELGAASEADVPRPVGLAKADPGEHAGPLSGIAGRHDAEIENAVVRYGRREHVDAAHGLADVPDQHARDSAAV